MVARYMTEGGDQDLELDLRLSFYITRKAQQFNLRKHVFDDEARGFQAIVEAVYMVRPIGLRISIPLVLL